MSHPSDNSLPSERDFDPWGGNLDAQCAWKNFGGKTLDEAHAKFRNNPLCYQEDFMSMGSKAFAYYFPVIDAYLRDVPDEDHYDDHQAWILARGILLQFEFGTPEHLHPLAPAVLSLAQFVLQNIRRFGEDDEERTRVADAWSRLVQHVQSVV